MSLNLPYPNMVFVPLDKLTAEELNDMHANTSYLARTLESPPEVATGTSAAGTTSSRVDIGNLRIQWGSFEWKNLNTTAHGFNTIKVSFPVGFKSASSTSVMISPSSDPTRVSGMSTLVTEITTTNFTANFNHIEEIGKNSAWFTWIAIGIKP